MHWLDETGSRYLQIIGSQKPRFLIELAVDQSEIETIFQTLHCLGREDCGTSRERRLCIAVAAINAAALAEDDDSSFIELFYRRMQRQEWAPSWEDTYAPAIWRALDENFNMVELQRCGSGRYVNSIYRHSGIPVRARAKFAAFLGKLLRSGGGDFTRREYDEALRSYPDSAAKTFLQIGSGYNFTRYLAKWYRRIPTAAHSDLSPCWRELLRSIERELSCSGLRLKEAAATRGYRSPYLALSMNYEEPRLEVRFDPRGIRTGIYSVAGQRVQQNCLPADDEPPQVSIRGEQCVPISPWWYPGESPSAVFRESTGALAPDPAALEPGIYWVATLAEVSSLSEISLLGGPNCGEYYKLYELNLEPGGSVPELGIRARGGTAAPTLKLSCGRPSSLGANLFQEIPPRLRISNLELGAGRRYMLWMNDGSGERQLPLPQDEEDEITIPCRYPAEAEIWLEDILDSANDVIDRVEFAVIPKIDLTIEEGAVGIDDIANLHGAMPVGWNIEWEPPIASVRQGQWRVPPAIKIAAGQLLGPDVCVQVSLRIHRVSLREENGTALLWKETFTNPDRKLRLNGPPGSCYSLMVADNQGDRLLYPDSFDATGVSLLNASSLNDAVQLDQGGAGELVLRLPNGRRFPTGVFLASADCLDTAQDSDLARLPGIGAVLAKYHRLRHAPEHSLDFPAELLMSPVCGRAAELTYGASVFDASVVGPDLDAVLKRCSKAFIQVIDWFRAASSRSHSWGLDATQLLEGYPRIEVEALPFSRWQRAATDIWERLRMNSEIPLELNRWKDELLSSQRGGRSTNRIETREGGRELTEAIRSYAQSCSWPKSEQEVAYTNVLKRLPFDSSDPVIQLLAESFRRLMFYRMGGAEAELGRPLPFEFPPCFQRLQATLYSLGGRPGTKWTCGLGLMEISPVAADAELEYELGRPRALAACK